jgi:flagellar basal-body rod modification protein FlgD
MSTTPTVTNAPGTIINTKTGETKTKDPNKDRDTFLLLLTTQLKNQDPTSPADTNQVTQQIALLSQVEQQTKSNTFLEKLVGMYTQGQASNAVSYIGKQIDATGNTGQLANGAASFVYTLPAGAAKATVNISDTSGKLVYSGNGTTIAGRNKVIWDGVNSVTGLKMNDGTYTFNIKAVDANNKDVTASTLSSGIVRAVETKDGVNSLSLGSFSVPIESIISVYNPAAAKTA